MYTILIYDVGVKRVSKVMKICRQYLIHVQNSVFEGEIGMANLVALKQKLTDKIDKETDSVVIYTFGFVHSKNLRRELLGVEKRNMDFII